MRFFEQLEPRFCMGGLDVNADGAVTPLDALEVIDAINNPAEIAPAECDVNADGAVTPLDALEVITHLNSQSAAESEPTVFYLEVDSVSTVGFTATQIGAAIEAATEIFESVANLDFVIVTSGGDVTLDSREIYAGSGVHYRGYWWGGDEISIHSGVISPYQHSGNNGPVSQTLYYQCFANEDAIARVIGHELGHWLGYSEDTTNGACMMHSNAGSTLCIADALVERFGPA